MSSQSIPRISASACFRRIAAGAALAALAVFQTTAMASITYIGSSFVSTFLPSGNGVYSPGAQPVINVTLFDDPNVGLKVSLYSVTYTANPIDNGTDVGLFWIAQRGLTSVGVTPVAHINHLDGSVSYSSGFQLVDATLRTITTQTDTDLQRLHLGPLPSGSAFDATLNTGTYQQLPGNDRLLSTFSLVFHQTLTATASDTFTFNLPSSLVSSVTAVPAPSAFGLLVSGLGVLGWAGRRARRAIYSNR